MQIKTVSIMLSLIAYSAANANEPNKNLPKICMVLDKAGKDDHGFNQEAYNGFQKALKTMPISKESKLIEVKEDAQLEQTIRIFAKSNCSAIFSVGINNAEALKTLAPKYPTQKFIAIDSLIMHKNVRSIIYRDDEGAFLVGAIAALKTSTNKIGFIGGMNIPLIHNFEKAYKAGASYVNSNISVSTAYVGVSVDAWNNPPKAQEIALSQYSKGVDIIFHAAGGSGLGVFNAAEKASSQKNKKFAIGCDSNQNWIKPGFILTSMMKGIEKSVLDTIKDIVDNKFTTGISKYGIQNGGIEWAYDANNKSLFTEDNIKKINEIKADIISEKIKIDIKEENN